MGRADQGKRKTEKQCSRQNMRMAGIDVETGMFYCDNDCALYLEVLTDFADNIEAKAGRLERAVREGDLAACVLEVHSLKSAAAYLGAAAVAEMARTLENNAKMGDLEAVERETPKLLSSYRNLYQSIAPYRVERTYTGDKRKFKRKEVCALLKKLWQCMEEYDIDGGEEIVRALEEYDLGKAWSGRRDRIVKAVSRYDYAACKKEALSWMAALEKES